MYKYLNHKRLVRNWKMKIRFSKRYMQVNNGLASLIGIHNVTMVLYNIKKD